MFKPLHGITRVVRIALVTTVAITVVDFVFGVAVLTMMDDIAAGLVDDATLDSIDQGGTVLFVSGVATKVITWLIFFVWFHRAYRNLPFVGRAPDNISRWPVIWWLIPIINLFKPFLMVQDIIKGCLLDTTVAMRLLGGWWVCHVTAFAFDRWANRIEKDAQSLSELADVLSLQVVVSGSAAIGLALLWVLVGLVARNQKVKAFDHDALADAFD